MAARKRIFKIVLEPAEDKPKEWYVATSPNLRGLVTQGQGVDETVENAKAARAAAPPAPRRAPVSPPGARRSRRYERGPRRGPGVGETPGEQVVAFGLALE